MTLAQNRIRLAGLEGRAAQLPKRNGQTIPEETELRRLASIAWGAYVGLVNARSVLPLAAAEAERGTSVRDGHKHQLLRSVSFAVTAGTKPEDIRNGERAEMHQMFAAEHPGHSQFGRPTHTYNWHSDKHADALALYLRLCAEEYL